MKREASLDGMRAILTAACPDTIGIVAAVSGFLAKHHSFIVESSQFGDPITGRFFMRILFDIASIEMLDEVRSEFGSVADPFRMKWTITDASRKDRLLLMVSKFDHCLNDLLYRYRTGNLNIEIAAVVSNHPDLESLATWHSLPFFHLPVSKATKREQEAKILDLVEELKVDLVVLARYMQVLTPEICSRLAGRCINIHHSFLPSFMGAAPYKQAHARGVKLIGATAHYVTCELDEGPIIEQAVERVDHTRTNEELIEIGRDIESAVLARAVRWHVERRVLLNGTKTIVFR
jgi:formyltetrahydrofolate deformylase